MTIGRVVHGCEEEGLDTEDVVGEGPRAHGLADDGDFVAELLFEDADRLDDGPVVGMIEEAVGHLDVVDGLPYGSESYGRWASCLFLPTASRIRGRMTLG